MSTKDERILNPDGGRYPFKVSDEYFDHLTARIMKQIPEEDVKPRMQALSYQNEASGKETKMIDMNKGRHRNLWIRAISIAASLLLIAAVALKFIPMSTTSSPTETLTAEYTDDDYNEDLMTYTMVDNMDIYYYLASDETEEDL
ncbi:MAG: hypothetical protein IJP82_02460 [Bacteroidaceae bacterium]|nr:hypothetical protein [Bacteroidaceae bacterium]